MMKKVIRKILLEDVGDKYDDIRKKKNSNKVKYINFIVDDLIRGVEVDPGLYIYVDGVELDYRGIASRSGFTIYHEFNYSLKKHMIDKYGISNNESELNNIWFKFRKRVREEILRPSDNKDMWVND